MAWSVWWPSASRSAWLHSRRRATLEDLGSKNGTELRGERLIRSMDLADGDEIRIGSVVVTFRMPLRPGSTVSLIREG